MKSHRLWIMRGIIHRKLIVLGTAGTVKAQTVSVVQTTQISQLFCSRQPSGCLPVCKGTCGFPSPWTTVFGIKNGWFRSFVYRFIRLVSMDEVDAKPAEYPDADIVHEFRSADLSLAAADGCDGILLLLNILTTIMPPGQTDPQFNALFDRS